MAELQPIYGPSHPQLNILTVEYREIPGFPGYLVSNIGTIWTRQPKNNAGKPTVDWRKRTLSKMRDGYLCLFLQSQGKSVPRLVHRVVLSSFVGPCPDGMEACHFPDATRSNNCIWNLRWDTRSENINDKFRHIPERKKKRCPVCGIVKANDDFHKSVSKIDGRQSICKECSTGWHPSRKVSGLCRQTYALLASHDEATPGVISEAAGCSEPAMRRRLRVLEFHGLATSRIVERNSRKHRVFKAKIHGKEPS